MRAASFEPDRADGRLSRGDIPFVVAAICTGMMLLYLGRSLAFWYDEWRSITFDGGFVDYFRPVNEHCSTIPLLLYRATFQIVELHSHSLVLGVGAESLFWAFQTGFVGSVAFGVWALVLVERPGRPAAVGATVLLVLSIMSSGIGPFLVTAVVARILTEAEYRRRAWIGVAPAVVYLAWHALLGRDGVVGSAGQLGEPVGVVRFALRGVGHAIEAPIGLDRLHAGGIIGALVFFALCAAPAVRFDADRRRGSPSGASSASRRCTS